MNSPDRSGNTVSARSYTTFWDTIGILCEFGKALPRPTRYDMQGNRVWLSFR